MLHRAPELTALALLLAAVGCSGASAPGTDPDFEGLTFNRDVAPILYEHCASCHRPGESAPFPLLTYRDSQRRAEQIVEVVESRYMPPWLPVAGEHAFAGERRMTEEEILTLSRWVRDGAVEGRPGDLPPPPSWSDGWQLGEPDLVVTMKSEYTLPAEGTDVFRNFVISVPVERTRWVRAIELRPGNKRIVHHAILQIDRTPASRGLDAQDDVAGFAGMDMGYSLPPDGQFIGWTPGKMPSDGIDDAAWRLDPGTDLVLQMHMLPTGKPEKLRPGIGFHFTEEPAENRASVIGLYIENIDIPAGERRHEREDDFELPVPVDVLGIYPHAHYLGKKVRAWVELPDGGETTLLSIDDWDFNWQDDYRYVEPVSLPAGSTIRLRWTYDNSKTNPRNPNYPPRRVRSGNRSSDEMGTLSLQVLTRNDHDRALLARAKALDTLALFPRSWSEMNNLGNALQDLGRPEEAIVHYRRALELQPGLDDARYNLGIALMDLGRVDEAIEQFETVLERNPGYGQAYNNLGNALLQQGRTDEAIELFRQAVTLQPGLEVARYNLGNAMLALDRYGEAAVEFRAALAIEPRYAMARNNLGTVYHLQGHLDEAIRQYRSTLAIDPDHVQAHTNLGVALVAQNRIEQAITHFEQALAIDPDFELARKHLEAARRSR